jgi:bifunctional DNA-binding transcriptional regulator/antitoxin component of YhaV-PrlF toxin-antitoxin module
MTLVKVRRVAQIALPAAIRKQLEIAEGEVVDGGVLLKPITKTERERTWAEITRIIDKPKWCKPPPMNPENEEQMIFEEIEELRHKHD